MKLIGLTGGIASGKSTVARMLRDRGVPVIDADLLAREVVAPGTPALAEIAARWPSVVRDGALDRRALGAIVFADPSQREALNAIVHPRIREASSRRLEELERAGAPRAVYEAALLIENGLDAGMDAVIVVSTPVEVQVARMMERDGLREEEARGRVAAQAPLAEKLARATFVIENVGDLAELQRRVADVWAEVERRY